jgi:predicted ATPase/class 3 adenylate cyclase/DNA-binding CsgD family transcriptional regulator
VSELPVGVVTFLFSDIEGSTRLVKVLRERYPQVLAEHRRLVRAAVAAHGGHEVDTAGDGFFVVFGAATQAVVCALEVQRALAAHEWPSGVAVRVRIGVHTGQAVLAGDGYTGVAVHRAARICAVAWGGQVLISQATQAVVEDEEEELGFTLVDVGERQLKGLDRPVRLFQLAAPGLDPVWAAGDEPEGTATTGGVHGFAAVLTSFVGRAGPAAEVARLLAECRLVTITGPGGSGKTRLAGEVARRAAARFADGAWLAELAPVQDPAQVPAVVAAALGVREQPGVPAGEALARVLARQQLLLVLDNCEHVIGAAAELCAALLAAADDVRILATSREPLAVAGEARYRLAPLAVPDPDDLASAARAEAVALFADRARRVDARFALTSDTAPVVAGLVARLDGMPLAIELAAARVETLGVIGLLDRLDDRFALLADGDRLAPRRQRSLAATVEWSYQLLDEDQRRVFRALSVFPGPFTLEAAEAVAGAGTGPMILRLVDCSMLVPPRTSPDGRVRYAMLETLRAYAARRLAEAGEQPAAALAGFMLGVAEAAAAELETGAGEVSAGRLFDAEDRTAHQALAWALEHDLDTAVRLALAMAPWWVLRGRYSTGYELLASAAASAEAGSTTWCAAQFWLGRLARTPGYATGLDHFTAVRDALSGRAGSPLLVEALNERSVCLLNLGQIREGADEARHALGLARGLGYPAGEARALHVLGGAAGYLGDHEAKLGWLRQAQLVDPASLPAPLVRRCIIGLAIALSDVGEADEAEQQCARALARAQEAGDLRDQADCLEFMTRQALKAGRAAEAAAHMREGVAIGVRMGRDFVLIDYLDLCGHLCALSQRPADALTAWSAHAVLLGASGLLDLPNDVERRQEPLRRARQLLGPDQARAAADRGAAMELATAAEYMLMLTTPTQPSDAGSDLPRLSARERELVTLVAEGRTDAQIAAELSISVRTVGSHLDKIRDKTGCRRRTDLTRLALTTGLV